ncbi:MAG: conjugal transfer protein TrbI [Alphaproteobacteria bacterium]|nr:conjugal transfer protein TrbI [Alphaproteobacteria bacterium]
MSAPESPTSKPTSKKANPKHLEMRATPRPVVRFKRGLLIGTAGISAVAIAGITFVALKPPHFTLSQAKTQVTAAKKTPDAVANLPKNYAQMHVPRLGPRLPGDLGVGIVEHEKALGLAPGGEADETARAARMRHEQQAEQAAQAGVFFQLNQDRTASGSAPVATPASANGPSTSAKGNSAGRLNLDPEHDQNFQQRKLDFENAASARSIYNDHALQTPASPYELMAGTVIAASLLTGLDSDLPGLVTAQITENVYDSVSGRVLLLPAGSRLIGSYDSVVAFGQSRALVVWQRIVMPDGSSIQIDNLPATDPAGYAGLKDEVDYHTWTLLKGIAMSTLLGVGTEASFGSNQSNLVEAIRQSTQESTNQAGQRIVEKDLNIRPTIKVRAGWPLRVVLHRDVVLRPYQGCGRLSCPS